MKEIKHKHIMENLKIDCADIIGMIIIIPMALLVYIGVMFLPLLVLSNRHSYMITKDNIFQFYVVSFLNILWIILFQKMSNAALLTYNIEYKRKQDDSISVAKRYSLTLVTFGVISNRLFVNILYLVVLIIGHLQDLEIITITNDYLSQVIKVNKYAIVIFNSMEKVISELNSTISFWPYKVKRWLEFFYMKRIRVFDDNTRQRIVYLFRKQDYKKLFYEFSYVVDEMIEHSGYQEYVNKVKLVNDTLFWRYYEAIGEDALILNLSNEDCIEDMAAYFQEKLNTECADHLINTLPKHDLRNEAVFDPANRFLHTKGMYLEYYYDQINNKVLLSIRSKSG